MRANWAGILAGIFIVSSWSSAVDVTIPATIRDFSVNHADFELLDWNLRTPTAFFANDQNNKIERGIVGQMGSPLGQDGLPVHSNVRDAGFYNTVPSASTFAQWWTDLSNVNITFQSVPLTFAQSSNGHFIFDHYDYFPIDGLGFGNEGFGHNYHYTMRFTRAFIYAPGQTFWAISDDDMWVYIDGKLALDAGGLHGTLGGEILLDNLNLIPGQSYNIDFLYAERNRYGASLKIDTTIPLPEPMAAPLLSMLAVLLCRRRQA